MPAGSRTSIVVLTLLALGGPAFAAPPTPSPPVRLGAVEGESYDLAVESTALEAGVDGVLRVILSARDGFKVSALYPTRLAMQAPPDGVHLPRTVAKLADARMSEDRRTLVFELPLRIEHAGRFALEGTLKLSVCSDKSCVIDTRRLRAELAVRER
ncbi:MAG: hypothetical protein IT373_32215 [Polyangiaceae bacterium]|nr:hypothetical protein [Polyangiaceae bacterium]